LFITLEEGTHRNIKYPFVGHMGLGVLEIKPLGVTISYHFWELVKFSALLPKKATELKAHNP